MEEVVHLTQEEFDALPEYSCTIPTGVVIGKQWKRGYPYSQPYEWWLCEYVDAADPKMVGITRKRIFIRRHTEEMPVELL